MRAQLTRDVNDRRVAIVQVYRTTTRPDGQLDVAPIVDVAAPDMPQRWPRASADRLAARVASGADVEPRLLEEVEGGGNLLRAASVIRNGARQVTGVVVASDYLSGDLAERSRRMTKAYEDYTQLRVLRQPLAGVYLSFFLMVTLLILVSSTWMGLYLAKRITRPVQLLSVAAREIGQGRYDQRIEHQATDEFGSMIEAFNAMAAELASSRRRLERAAIDLERKNQEVDGRRRYIETILERVATGVISIDPAGRIGTVNAAAMRLLEVDAGVVGQPAVDVFGRTDLQPINGVLDQAARARADAFAQEVAIVREGRELHVAAAATRLTGAGGDYEGTVLVLDDVTPLIRAQKVAAWREVARRLAHEIKNPLTPIQLSAERMRRKLSTLDGGAERSGGRVHQHHHRRGRIAEEPGRRVLAVRAHADAARRAHRPAASCSLTRWRSTTACSPTCASSASSRTACRACRVDPEQTAPGDHQPRRQCHRGHRSERPDRGRRRLRPRQQPGAADRGRRRRRDPAGGAGEAVPAVLPHQGTGQRPRPRHRPPHRRRTRRQYRRVGQRAARHLLHDRTAGVSRSGGRSRPPTPIKNQGVTFPRSPVIRRCRPS